LLGLNQLHVLNVFRFEIDQMARQCEVCGKSVQVGNRVEIRGKAKYLGGVGTKVTGITRRKFVPNLQKIHVTLPSGENTTMRVCVQCIRSGAIRKTVKTKPFELGTSKTATKSKAKATA
jgi:large subunit ribosomal protein L28